MISIIASFKKILILIFIVSLTSCSVFRPKIIRNSRSLVETFYIGEGGMQYFVKPVQFSNKNNEKMNMDLTFQYNRSLDNKAIVNYTLFTHNLVREVESLVITTKTDTFKVINNEILFMERDNRNFTSRFSGRIELEDLKSAFNSDEWEITVVNPGQQVSFQTTNRTSRELRSINHHVFMLME